MSNWQFKKGTFLKKKSVLIFFIKLFLHTFFFYKNGRFATQAPFLNR